MIDTLRLILFLECNMSCSYCCNEREEVRKNFREKDFDEIDFTPYKNVCITGGEPFLQKDLLYQVLNSIPGDKKIFIYTNGLLINNHDIFLLVGYDNIKGINIGVHTKSQLKGVNVNIETFLPVRFLMRDLNYNTFRDANPERINNKNVKLWKMNNCDMPNEDWVLLKQ